MSKPNVYEYLKNSDEKESFVKNFIKNEVKK